jgi:hypothetical protein
MTDLVEIASSGAHAAHVASPFRAELGQEGMRREQVLNDGSS